MKTTYCLAAAAALATAAVRADGAFGADDQALWIDRFNYFRMTGLPWSAGNMRRIGWDADLATAAATTAASCSASTAAGVTAYTVSSTANSSLSVVDQAVNDWIVTTSLSTLATLAAPGASGDGVGTGVYNSYSQAVWAETYSVGCASATCTSGELVVCKYSPAGNDGSSAWYIHADTASACPTGTTALTGLCIVEGDAANDAIAAIPAGQQAYEVFPSYVSDMQTVLLDAARAVASGTTAPPATTTAAPTATTAAPTATTKTPTATTKTPTATTKTPTATTKTPTATTATPTTSTSSGEDDGESSPGTVKASSASGSSFTNTATSTTSSAAGTSTTGASTTGTSTTGTTTTAESATAASTTTTTTTTDSTAAGTSTTTTSSDASDSTAVSANNKSGDSSSGVSATGMAGVIVVAVAGVAGVAVFVSYRKNQQRQRDIMQNGGIHVL